uniref:Uncharacterized protein n=1 Tax=Rhizophora mucronata TaxID=61149 RepID=A0A2P2L4I3_RHIMU
MGESEKGAFALRLC